jgi:hypothetical protein
MTNQEIAEKLYEYCKEYQYFEAHEELYAENVTSTETNMAGELQTIEGMNALQEKTSNFQKMIEEIHSGYVKEPKIFGNSIFMEMGLDITMKGQGRMEINEMCHYVVENGKIISERFYY